MSNVNGTSNVNGNDADDIERSDEVTCISCSSPIEPDRIVKDDNGDPYCEECYCETYTRCEECNDEVLNDDVVIHADRCYCEECADRLHPQCQDCGNRCNTNDHTYNDEPLCERCYDRNYFYCEGCDSVCHNDDYGDDSRCVECTPDDEEGDESEEEYDEFDHPTPRGSVASVRRYSNKEADEKGPFGKPIMGTLPLPDVRREPLRFTSHRGPTSRRGGGLFGVELEVECGRSYGVDDLSAEVYRRIGSDFVTVKEDSSLTNGFEIVTAPADLTTHAERFARLLHSRIDGLRAWSTETAGMHVHYSRSGISPFTTGKLLVFMNDPRNNAFVARIAGRRDNTYCERTDARIRDARQYPRNRYRRLNLQNANTIEFRIFRATLKYSRLMANIEFCAASIAFARDTAPGDLTSDAFVAFVGKRPKAYRFLSGWMRENDILPKPKAKPLAV
jgi:hypothetical protein